MRQQYRKQQKTRFKSLLAPIISMFKKPGPRTAALQKRRSRRHNHVIRIKNKKRILIVCCGVTAAVLLAVVIISSSTPSDSAQVASVQNDLPDPTFKPLTESLAAPPVPTVVRATVVEPVYTSLSLSSGMRTSVVADMQMRLMELEYMDNDEADGIFGKITEEAVNLFKEQHGLDTDGVADQEMLDLLYSSQAQYYAITIGAKNTDVDELQQRLRELGYIEKVDGAFGEKTEAAVKKFQERNNLTVDGKVGRKTREMLYSGNAVANVLSYGENSPEIINYQKRLKKLGYLMSEPDGAFGSDTRAAVKSFQEASGLIADGHIGPLTKEALLSAKAQGIALAIGSRGDLVTTLQKKLKSLGYMSSVTGYFGSQTDSAVRSFQRNNGLSIDGKAGRKTLSVLNSSKAKKASSSDKPSDGGGGGSSDKSIIDSFIKTAESKLGSKYVRGKKGPDRFDCSGFVYWCLNKVGVKQGYLTSAGWASCTKYKKIKRKGDLKRGDIMVLKGHVAIVAGNGYIIDASASNGKVVKRKYSSSWWSNNFICGFRVF